MTLERTKPPQLDILTIKEELLAHQLYVEGKYYKEHFRGEARMVGTHLSFFIHEIDGNKVLSIHFREGMEELNESTSPARTFLRNIGEDLRQLAEMLNNPIDHPELAGVGSIVGLSHLWAEWGKRNGFTIKKWSNDPGLIEPFVKSVGSNAARSDKKGIVLTLFTHEKDTFIQEFLHKRPRKTRTPQP